MLIRTATIKDIGTLVDFGKRLTDESPKFQAQGFDEDRAVQFFRHIINEMESIFFICDEYDNPVGVAICLIDVDWRSGQRVAFEQGIYVLPEYRKTGAGSMLVQYFVEWAKGSNADRIQIGTMTNIHVDRTVALYESLGFELSGFVLEMEV